MRNIERSWDGGLFRQEKKRLVAVAGLLASLEVFVVLIRLQTLSGCTF